MIVNAFGKLTKKFHLKIISEGEEKVNFIQENEINIFTES